MQIVGQIQLVQSLTKRFRGPIFLDDARPPPTDPLGDASACPITPYLPPGFDPRPGGVCPIAWRGRATSRKIRLGRFLDSYKDSC
eukprot:389412-Prorocentrum_minimum.AAC.1